MFQLENQSFLQRHPDMVFSRIDDEVVMMSIETGEYYGLNPVASRIWELLEKPHTFDRLLGLLMQEFNVGESACREDVQIFLEQMIQKRLIISNSNPT